MTLSAPYENQSTMSVDNDHVQLTVDKKQSRCVDASACASALLHFSRKVKPERLNVNGITYFLTKMHSIQF